MVAISGLFGYFRGVFFAKKKNVHELLKALHEFNRFIPPKYQEYLRLARTQKLHRVSSFSL